MENYIVAMLVFAGLYGLMALGLNVIWGMAGMINLGLVGFVAFGAYISALLTLKAQWPMWAALVAAAVGSAGAGVVMALVTARLRGDYLAIVTLGFSEVVRLIASNEIWLTNGTDGISNIPGPYRGQVSPAEFNLIFLALVAVVLAIVLWLLNRLRHSPYGRVLRAIRDDDQVVAVAGKRVIVFKTEAFAVSAAVLGLAGGLYGHYNAYIAPDGFTPIVTVYIVLALTAGGTGNNWGAAVGALLVVFFMESTRFLTARVPGLEAVQVAALREFLIGASLILVLRFFPNGLLPERIRVVEPPTNERQKA
jgi:branched-chain amino acid transport system permease protein